MERFDGEIIKVSTIGMAKARTKGVKFLTKKKSKAELKTAMYNVFWKAIDTKVKDGEVVLPLSDSELEFYWKDLGFDG